MLYSQSNPYVLSSRDDLDELDREQLDLVCGSTRADGEAVDDASWHFWPAPGQCQEEFLQEMECCEDFNQPRGWLIVKPGAKLLAEPDDRPAFACTVVEVKEDKVRVRDDGGNLHEVERARLNLLP